MISAEYFRSKFEEAVRQTAGRVRAEIHLHSRAIFEIEAVLEIEDGYVVIRAYPPDDRDHKSGREADRIVMSGEAPIALDRVAIPYESIVCVHLSPTEKDARRVVGFQPQ